MRRLLFAVVLVAIASPAFAQIGGLGRKVQDANAKKQKAEEAIDQWTFTDAERLQIGTDISTQLRNRFGVVQDPKIHKYVTLVGMTLARASAKPSLPWQFIVLDTDGVNAYASPGGFIHVTRGALAFLKNEAELAGVLGHEIGHVTADHTVAAIKKAQRVQAVAGMTRNDFLKKLGEVGYSLTFENAFDRGDEVEADATAVSISGKAGYSAVGLSSFLERLAERNKENKEPNGLFASHPVIRERTGKISAAAKAGKFTSVAVVAPRYTSNVSFKPVAFDAIATVPAPAAAEKPAEKSGPRLGVGSVKNALSSGSQKQSAQATGSAGARGARPDFDAKGGPIKTAVKVTITDAELASFKAAIS